jgi:uncharacterized protein (DUF2235 family)
MQKKLVLFSDGTGNSSAKLQKTNVWRLFEALEQNRCDVRAIYDDGVGTSSNRYLAALGGAFGWGLKRNALHLYKFVCRNYAGGDAIYGFGFSRGAFTIRVVAGLIAREGLVTFRTEEELDHNAKVVYRRFRTKAFPSKSPVVIVMRALRDAALALRDWLRGHPTYVQLRQDMKSRDQLDVRIRFLGVWDTVEAYGMPVLELKRAIDWVIWPMMFGDLSLSPKVDRACHALSLDDERTTFHPLIWDEWAEAELVKNGRVKPGRITQVWFPGVHANVGGGYPEDKLALIPLAWMMNQAAANDLPLDVEDVKRINAEKSPYAKLYDSRAGVAAYYRYSPRNIPIAKPVGGVEREILPIVHSSAILRMVHGSDAYAPITLPQRFWVLAPDGMLLPMQGFQQTLTPDSTKRADTFAAAPSMVKPPDTLQGERNQLETAMKSLTRPSSNVVGLVWDTVWYRRLGYFTTCALTLLLILYPFTGNLLGSALYALIGSIPVVGPHISEALRSAFDQSDGSSSGLVEPIVDALAGFIPAYLGRWTRALVDNPITFGSLAVAVIVSMSIGGMLRSRIHDRAWLAWHIGEMPKFRGWLLSNSKGWRNAALVGFGVALFALIVYYYGYLNADAGASPDAKLTIIELAVVAGLFLCFALFRMAEVRRHRDAASAESAGEAAPGSFGLSLARHIRTNGALVGLYRGVFTYAVPILFALALIAGAALLSNRVAFDVASAAGAFCRSPGKSESGERLGSKEGFVTSNMCWPSGLRVEGGQRYVITLTTPGDWFDHAIRTDVAGTPADNPVLYLAIPLRRWWAENYFKPVVRVGSVGNDEYVLEPERAFSPLPYCRSPEVYGTAVTKPGEEGLTVPSPRNRSEKEMRAACSTCAAVKPEVQEGGSENGRIKKESARALLDCSPTPEARKTVKAIITPRTSGEVFVYVNDAILAIPGGVDFFYRNNSGSASITVEHAP